MLLSDSNSFIFVCQFKVVVSLVELPITHKYTKLLVRIFIEYQL